MDGNDASTGLSIMMIGRGKVLDHDEGQCLDHTRTGLFMAQCIHSYLLARLHLPLYTILPPHLCKQAGGAVPKPYPPQSGGQVRVGQSGHAKDAGQMPHQSHSRPPTGAAVLLPSSTPIHPSSIPDHSASSKSALACRKLRFH